MQPLDKTLRNRLERTIKDARDIAEDAARAALEQGAAVNATDSAGRTALMLTARRGNVGIARALIDAGADPRQPDRQGLTAIDHARRAGHEALARWLQERASPR